MTFEYLFLISLLELIYSLLLYRCVSFIKFIHIGVLRSINHNIKILMIETQHTTFFTHLHDYKTLSRKSDTLFLQFLYLTSFLDTDTDTHNWPL